MRRATEEPFDEHPFRTLVIALSAGAGMWLLGLFLLLTSIQTYSPTKFDPSVLNFYPIMAEVGAVFGFERWWTYESGGVNPFHDR